MKSADSATTVWLKTKTTLDGNWQLDITNQEKIISAIDAAMKDYGAQVREEAAKLCHYESSAEEIAAAIRKMELP